MCKYIWPTLKSLPSGVLWVSWRSWHCIAFGIQNHPLFCALCSCSFSAISSSSLPFAVIVISTPSYSSIVCALELFFPCFFSKSPCNHSRPLSSKQNRCAGTNDLCCSVDAVEGRGWGLGLAKKSAIVPNHSSCTMPGLMSSIHSPAAGTSSGIQLRRSRVKAGWRDNMSLTWFSTPRMSLTSQSICWRTIGISIRCMVRCGCVRIQFKGTWSVCTTNGCSAWCRLIFQYNVLSRMPNTSLLYAGYSVSALRNSWLNQCSIFCALSWPRESTVPNA